MIMEDVIKVLLAVILFALFVALCWVNILWTKAINKQMKYIDEAKKRRTWPCKKVNKDDTKRV